ncbi:MAG: hypothetical protein HGB03_00950 [Candidatus Yonathbacteria bacterium]|nr:hypothetical protein [Candidatus Yonathbacteria bacterium]
MPTIAETLSSISSLHGLPSFCEAEVWLGRVVGIEKYKDGSGFHIFLFSANNQATNSEIVDYAQKDGAFRVSWVPDSTLKEVFLCKKIYETENRKRETFTIKGCPERIRDMMIYLGMCPVF